MHSQPWYSQHTIGWLHHGSSLDRPNSAELTAFNKHWNATHLQSTIWKQYTDSKFVKRYKLYIFKQRQDMDIDRYLSKAMVVHSHGGCYIAVHLYIMISQVHWVVYISPGKLMKLPEDFTSPNRSKVEPVLIMKTQLSASSNGITTKDNIK